MLVNTDAIYFLTHVKPARTIFADVPDNIGLPYMDVGDNKSPVQYRELIEQTIRLGLDKSQILWLSFNSIHMLWICELFNKILNNTVNFPRKWTFKLIIWRYTFGQYRDSEIPNGFRPIALCIRDGTQLNLDAIRVESERMKLGDRRAQGPRVPDDVWEYPRVVGNARERRSWHPTQHPETLLVRIILLSCTETYNGRTSVLGNIIDPFLGSGTTAIVAERLGVPWSGCDLSLQYISKISEILDCPIIGYN